MAQLKVTSFNCQSFESNLEIICEIVRSCDVLLLQETFLTEDFSNNLKKLGDEFEFIATPATRNPLCFTGRASGGLAIVYKKIYSRFIQPFFQSDRIMGIYFKFADMNYLLLNVYLPCDYGNTEAVCSYKSYLAELSIICNMRTFDEIVIAGDFNCDPTKGRFYRELSSLISTHSLHVTDVINLPADSYTYMSSNSTCSTSWLDHVVTSRLDLVRNIDILYGVTLDDHVPVSFSINVGSFEPPAIDPEINATKYFHINWDKKSDDEISFYKLKLDYFISDINDDSISCTKVDCSDANHLSKLGQNYSDLIYCMLECSKHLHTQSKNSFRIVPGWNDQCKILYHDARERYFEWMSHGKIRSGLLFEDMKTSRALFKNALKNCRDNEKNIRKEKMLESFYTDDRKTFWKNVKRISAANKCKNSSKIDGFTENRDIVQMFNEKFASISGVLTTQSDQNFLRDGIICDGLSNFYFSPEKIRYAIGRLNMGQSWDGVHSQNLKYVGDQFVVVLGRIFASLLRHGYLPKQMLLGEIRPTLKDNKVSKSDSSNYRPVMNSSILLKVFEYCILPILERNITLNSRQFGFRKHTGCTNAVSLLKEVISKYNSSKSNVFCGVLDLSKAFDRIDFSILNQKLMNTSVPPIIVRIIYYMLANSVVRTVYNGVYSSEWKLQRGVRQGGILSAFLFSFYIDEMLQSFSKLNVGCTLGHSKLNILSYADDLVLMAPTASGLQILLDRACTYLQSLKQEINLTKSSYIIFKYRKSNNLDFSIYLQGMELTRSKTVKYLGVVIDEGPISSSDIDRCVNSFLSQFNFMYYNFFRISDEKLKAYLFNSYCTSFFGIETWYDILFKPTLLRKISVAYHKAIKKLCGMMVWESNHLACEKMNLYIFSHLLSKRIMNFYFSNISSNSPCLSEFKFYYYSRSLLSANVRKHFLTKYSVIIDDFDRKTLNARINFVQRNEERSNYVYNP